MNETLSILQLPLYPAKENIANYRFVESGPLPMEHSVSVARIEVQEGYVQFMVRY